MRTLRDVCVGARHALPLLLVLLAAAPASGDVLIGAPDSPPSSVDASGALHEDWGVVGLSLEEPAGTRPAGQRCEMQPGPTAVTTLAAGAVTLTATAYRAPIWPAGVDVLSVRLANGADREAAARLKLMLPDGVSIGERMGTLGGRAVLALPAEPAPVRAERGWGCTGGVVPMPGWARPEVECDPAFRNISAGMGGVPIIYRFGVPSGAKRTVVLGLCESHWAQAGQRPLVLYVEGAPRVEVDPIAAWGQHRPGCLRFDARDLNGDGRLQVVVAPHPDAQDRNTILNVIWVFSPDVYVDLDQVLRGELSAAAEYYVDVGGDRDQTLYDSGELTYDIAVAPRAARELTFLIACPGGTVPNLETAAWTPEALRRAAEDVWGDWFASGARLALPRPLLERWRGALAQIMMTRAQADGFYAALPGREGMDKFCHAHAACILAALDYAGYCEEAERMLRAYWDKPVPEPLANLAQAEDGRWQDATGDPCAHGYALQALARHALLSGDAEWAQRAWPAIKAGAAWLQAPEAQAALSAQAKRTAAAGLMGAARVAEALGAPDAEQLLAEARALDPTAAWGPPEAGGDEDSVAQAALDVARLRNALVVERGRELWLLSGLDASWLDGDVVSAHALPTDLGPISLSVDRDGNALIVTTRLDSGRGAEALVIRAPALDGRAPISAQVDGREIGLDSGGEVVVRPAGGTHRVVVLYP